MLTNQGQLERLRMWVRSGPKYAALLNMPDIDKTTKLSETYEAYGERTGYYRQEIPASAWSVPQITAGGNAEVYATVRFGPFNEEIECTHVAVCSSPNGDGILYLFCPLANFLENGEPQVFQPGEMFEVLIREEQI